MEGIEGGARLFCPSPNGDMFVAGSRLGWVGLFSGSRLVDDYDVRPVDRRKTSERELQAVTIGTSPDLLYCATSVDIMAINVQGRETAWSKRQKRQWGFLPSLPQGAYMATDDQWAVTYSSGEMTIFDRKGRVIETGYFERAPRFLTWSHHAKLVYGSDAHSVYTWSRDTLQDAVQPVWSGVNYGLALSPDGTTLFIRGEWRVISLDTSNGEVIAEFEVGAGLPAMAADEKGDRIAILAEDRVSIYDQKGGAIHAIDCDGQYPLGLLSTGNRLVVGTREGRIFESEWT